MYLGNQKPLQQKTQRGYAFCAPAAPKRKKASSLNDDANLWRARSGGPRSVERPAARRAAWSGRPLLLPGRRTVASPSTSLIDSAALDGAVSSARRGAGWGVGAAGVERSSGPAPEEPPEPVLAGGAARSLCSPEMPPAPVWMWSCPALQAAGVRAPPPLLVPWSQACGRRRRSEAHAADGEEEEWVACGCWRREKMGQALFYCWRPKLLNGCWV